MSAIRSQVNQSLMPLVVKVGGSLFHDVSDLVPVLNESKRPLLLIPGGGPFADLVRQCEVDDDTAHWMAVSAMEQFGWFIASHGIPVTTIIAIHGSITVLLPYRYFIQNDVLPHTWDVTSDTIAAWVAGNLHVDLLLLKSVDGIYNNGILQKQITAPVETDVIDPFFIPYVLKNSIKTTIVNGSQANRVGKFLKGERVPGTKIGTTF
ncbi:MAG TPA: uridylate kinase [Methanoregula sp.]|nr:uridylate kinase [Methanoregula sp.]